MTLGRFAIPFAFGLAAAIEFKLTWLYWLLSAALMGGSAQAAGPSAKSMA